MKNVPAGCNHVDLPSEDANALIAALPDDGYLQDLSADGAVDVDATGPVSNQTDWQAAAAAASSCSSCSCTTTTVTFFFDVILSQNAVVVIGIGYPGPRNAEARPDDVLDCKHEKLEPDPAAENTKGEHVDLGEDEVIWIRPEVCDGQHSQDRLPDNELPAQGTPAVAHHVAMNLRYPQGHVEEDTQVEVQSTKAGVPRRRGYGDEGDAEADEEVSADNIMERLPRRRRGGCSLLWRRRGDG